MSNRQGPTADVMAGRINGSHNSRILTSQSDMSELIQQDSNAKAQRRNLERLNLERKLREQICAEEHRQRKLNAQEEARLHRALARKEAEEDRQEAIEREIELAELRASYADTANERQEALLTLQKKRAEQELSNVSKKYAALGKSLSKSEQAALKNSATASFQTEERQATLELLRTVALHGETKEERQEADGDRLNLELINGVQNMVKGMVEGMGRMVDSALQKFQDAIDLTARYYSAVNTRLIGSEKDFSSIVRRFRGAGVSYNPIIKYADLLENMSKLVQTGINYNVEQRAYLMTVSDKIATTFEANNATLLQLIRIQQADSTQARLGMEARLTEFLNSAFQDTSYLSTTYDSVSTDLLSAVATMGRDMGAEFEYTVQKWLGSMGAVGFSDSTLSSIARGMSYLATGDVESLSSNSALQNLLVMSANKANLSYSDLLLKGVSATNANEIMKSMVEIMREYGTINNQVVRTQYANLFGMSISDLTAALNLVDKDLKNISDNQLDYASALQKASDMLSSAGSRMHISELVDNVFDNILANIGQGIANSPTTSVLWKALDLLQGIGVDTKVPTVGVLGSFVDTGLTMGQISKMGIAGFGMLSSFIGGLTSLSQTGKLGLDGLGATEKTSHGTGFSNVDYGKGVGTSSMSYIGNSDTNALYKQSINSNKELIGDNIGGTDIEDEQQKGKDREQREDDANKCMIEQIYPILSQVLIPEVQRIKTLLEEGISVKVSNFPVGGSSSSVGV